MITAAVIGCGPRGREHAKAIQEIAQMELVGLADRAAQPLHSLRTQLNVPGYTSQEELFEKTRPEVVVLAIPPSEHASSVVQAAACPSVRAIVCEKPMALTLRDAEQMIATCDGRGILLTICHHFRFAQEFIRMKAALEAGEIGKIEFLRGVCYGNLLNQGSHVLDALRHLAGPGAPGLLWAMSQAASDPEFLSRHVSGERGYWLDETHPTPMWMTHHLAFAGGIRATLETGLLCQASKSGQDDWLQRRVVAIGTEGIAIGGVGCFRLLTSRRSGWQVFESGPETNRAATQAFHQEVCDSLHKGTAHRGDARDALLTLDGLLACAQSAADGDVAVLPVSRRRDPIAELASRQERSKETGDGGTRGVGDAAISPSPCLPVSFRSRTARFSVIVPLLDHRGCAFDCVQGWHTQTFPRASVELIVVSDGADTALDASLQKLLLLQDQFLYRATASEAEMRAAGADKATGQVLMLTESHCIPEPECLEELSRFLNTHDVEGACCRSIGVCENAFARIDERSYNQGIGHARKTGDWRWAGIHAFAVYRSTYQDVGGIEWRFGRAGEWVFAGKLREHNRRIGYASGAVVQHVYGGKPGEVLPFLTDYANGDCAFREAHSEAECRKYSCFPPEWQRNAMPPYKLSQIIRRALGKSLVRSLFKRNQSLGARAALSSLRWFLLPSLLSPRLRLLAAACAVRWSMFQCWLWQCHEKRLTTAASQLTKRVFRSTCLRYEMKHSLKRPELLLGHHEIADLPGNVLFGFHDLETFGSDTFRWTGPVAAIYLPLREGEYDIVLDTRGLGQEPAALKLQAFYQGRQLSKSAIAETENEIILRVRVGRGNATEEPWLVLLCNPLRPWKQGSPDNRELGLPIASLAVTESVGAWTDSAEGAAAIGSPSLTMPRNYSFRKDPRLLLNQVTHSEASPPEVSE